MIHSENILEVTMFGEFFIQKNEFILKHSGSRTKQVWLLIEYLIIHRNQNTSMERLIDLLWENEEASTNPINALKNLVYRARTTIRQQLHDEETEFILFKDGVYSWNPNIKCIVDAEEFQRISSSASSPMIQKEDRIQLYQKACQLYKGEFLPNSSYSTWIIADNAHYSSLYAHCVISLCSLLQEKEAYEDIIKVCNTAVSYLPYQEPIHKMLIYSYICTNQINEALEHYRHVAITFYRDLSISLTDSFSELYNQIIQYINPVEQDIDTIRTDLRENHTVPGAYYCEYEVFRNLYRVQARLLPRINHSIFVTLLSIMNEHEQIPVGKEIVISSSLLKNSILSCLRKGDTVAPYSSNQFIIMLPMITQEDTHMVTNRIITHFNKFNEQTNLHITTTLFPIKEFEL